MHEIFLHYKVQLFIYNCNKLEDRDSRFRERFERFHYFGRYALETKPLKNIAEVVDEEVCQG